MDVRVPARPAASRSRIADGRRRGNVVRWRGTPETEAAGRRHRRKKKHHHQQGKDKQNRKGKGKGKDKGKDKCTKAGQAPQKGNPCCEGLVEDGAGQCAQPASPTCAQTCTGCCNGETCVTSLSDSACGTGGIPCGVCSGVQGTCRNGACTCDVCASGCPFTSVQAAVTAASPGDTITICAGTYVGITTINKSLTLLGAGDGNNPAVDTILDGNNAGAVIGVAAGQTVSLSGLRLTRGRQSSAGGVRNQGMLTMSDCTVVDNECTSTNCGGGIDNDANLTMTDCVVSQNRIVGFSPVSAGGIRNGNTLDMTRCTVSDNTNGGSGGGGGIRHDNDRLDNAHELHYRPKQHGRNWRRDLRAQRGHGRAESGRRCKATARERQGGGIALNENTTLRLRSNSRVQDNSALIDGGGISNPGGTVELDASVVGPNNTAAGNGGGILNRSFGPFTGTVTLSGNSSVEANHADGQGGGIFNQGTVTGCGTGGTVTGNTAGTPTPVASNCVDDGMSASGCTSC